MTTVCRRDHLSQFAVLAAVSLVLAIPAYGQSESYVTNSNLRGVVASGSYQFGDIDNVNLGTGTLNVRIPLFTRKGRGLDDGRFLIYSNKLWIAHLHYGVYGEVVGFQWFPDRFTAEVGELQGGSLEYSEQFYACPSNPGYVTEWVRSNFIYRASDGAQYRFPNRDYFVTGGACGNPGVEIWDHEIGLSDSGTMELNTSGSTYTIRFKDGRTQTFYPRQTRDSNGNQVNYEGDTLKRLYPYQNNQITVKDSDGTDRTYRIEYTNLNFNTAFPSSSCGSQYIQQYSNNLSVISRLVLPNNQAFVFSYNPPPGQPASGEITRIDLPSGGYIRYEYVTLQEFDEQPALFDCRLDSRRLQKRIVSADGVTEQVWQYAYERLTNPDRYRTTVTDPENNLTVHTFDVDGIHELETEIRQGASTTLQKVSRVWQRDFGPVQSDQYNGTDADYRNWRTVSTTTTLYPTNQVRKVETDYDSYTYSFPPLAGTFTDSRMNEVETREYDFGAGSAGPLVRKTQFSYLHPGNASYLDRHILDRVISRRVYDASGNLKAETQYGYDTTAITATSGAVQHDYANYSSTMIYRGNLTETRRWHNLSQTWFTTFNWYDDLGNLRKTQHMREGHEVNTLFSYADLWTNSGCLPQGGTAQAFLTRTTNALAQVSTATYFACSSLTGSATDINNQTTSYSYDQLDRIRQETRPGGGGQTTWTYDDTFSANVSPKVTITSDKDLLNDNQLKSEVVFDGLARKIKTRTFETSSCAIETRQIYNGRGLPSQVSNPYRPCNSETPLYTTAVYDALGRVATLTTPDGAAVTSNYNGTETTVTDQAGKKRRSAIDGLGRLVSVLEDPDGLAYGTTYQYDVLDNLRAVAQGQQTRSFVYDSLSRLTSATNPENGSMSYNYDEVGNLKQKMDVRGAITYGYDDLNWLLTRSYTDSTPPVAYTYDENLAVQGDFAQNYPAGRLVRVSSSVSETVYRFDANGRVQASQQATGSSPYRFLYGYNLAGGLTSQTYPSGRVVTTEIDLAGRARTVGDGSKSYASQIDYAAHGPISVMKLGNSLWEHTNFNNSNASITAYGRLQPVQIGLGTTSTNTTVLELDYDYGPAATNNGNVLSQTIKPQPSLSIPHSYTYDPLNRLSTFTETGGWSQTYTYGRYGNRLVSGNIPNPAQTPSAFNDSTNKITGGLWSYSTGSIETGNLTMDGAGNTYAYNLDGLQTNFNGTASYHYDGEGRRVKKTVLGVTTIFIYNGFGQLSAEYGTPSEPGGTRYLTTDHLGSTRLITDDAQAIIARYDYLPFGEEIPAGVAGRTTPMGYSSADPTSQHFSGKERDAESGLDYFGARYFSGPQGRFTSPDSTAYSKLGNPQSWNLYGYSFNNPLRFIDPTGNEVQAAHCRTLEECQNALGAVREALGNKKAESRIDIEKVKSGLWGSKFIFKISGDVSSFRALGENANRLADLIASSKVVEVAVGDKYKQASGGWDDTPGGIALTEVNPARVTVGGNPALFDKDLNGFIRGAAGKIPGAKVAEGMAHELLGHAWSAIISGYPTTTFQNARDALLAENTVRATDPTRGLKVTHHSYSILKLQDIQRFLKK